MMINIIGTLSRKLYWGAATTFAALINQGYVFSPSFRQKKNIFFVHLFPPFFLQYEMIFCFVINRYHRTPGPVPNWSFPASSSPTFPFQCLPTGVVWGEGVEERDNSIISTKINNNFAGLMKQAGKLWIVDLIFSSGFQMNGQFAVKVILAPFVWCDNGGFGGWRYWGIRTNLCSVSFPGFWSFHR